MSERYGKGNWPLESTRFPFSPSLHLAMTLFSNHQEDAAMERLRDALGIDSGFVYACNVLGGFSSHRHDHPEALPQCRKS